MFKPMTETEYYCATLDDINEWAENIRGEWHDCLHAPDNSKEEWRAGIAEEVQDKIAELKELLGELA
jgi:hypothetical protein